jgi:serine/threonine-protein kinase
VQVLRALEFAHGAGVLHHALRPSNVMVTRQGTVKVLDFGIGHALGANRKTREDRLLTVLAYLAPEQIQNQPGDVRADIYSVGVLLYELLTGKLPFDHKTEFALRQAHLAQPPAPPRTIVPGLPEWLDQAVLRALAKSPASRYQNATEFRAVLEAALGLSTSREAAIVRQRDGATAETFTAAPPLPPPPPPTSAGGVPDAGAAATVARASSPPASPAAGLAETLIEGAPVAAPLPQKRGRRPLVAAGLVVLALAAAGAYLLTRVPAPEPPAGGAPGEAQAPPQSPAAADVAPAETPAQAPVQAAPQPPPATASPAASSTSSVGQAQVRKSPPPAAVQKPPAPEPSVAAPPPANPQPPAPASEKPERTPDVSYRKVKLVTQAGSSEKSTDVVLLFSDDRISVTPADGGAALRTLSYAEITAASYSKAQKKRLGFIKSAQHLLEIETGGEPLLLRLDKDNFGQILSALEARSGKVVNR